MIRPALFIVFTWLYASIAVCQEAKAPATLPELHQRLDALVSHPKFAGAEWGIKVASLDSGKTLFEHNARKLLSPASNSKLYTVALALDRLGADYRIRTALYAAGRPGRSRTLKGDLILYGRGDPTINARLHGGSILKALAPLAEALTNAGVKRITGDLVADQSFFRGPEFGSGWAWDDMLYYYGAEISALTINDNILQVNVKPGDVPGLPCQLTVTPPTPYITLINRTRTAASGARRTVTFYRPLGENVIYANGQMALGTNSYNDDLTLHNPAGLFAGFFREALAQHGVKLKGKVRTVNWLDRQAAPIDLNCLVELGSMESLPLGDIAREVQKPSQNLYTDLLLAHVGERMRSPEDPPDMTSEDLGIRELNKFLAEAGIEKGDVVFEEGSGLSRNNLTTASATVSLLEYMSRHKWAKPYTEALPIAGVDGSLRNRMKDTPAAGNVRAKTGSLRWANSLSGYLTNAAGERLVFSLMLNRYNRPATPARAELDAITMLLVNSEARTAAAAQ